VLPLIATIAIALTLVGAPHTNLTIVTQTGTADASLHTSRATLRCDDSRVGGTGYLRRQAKQACRLIGSGTLERVARAQRSRRLCSQIYSGPQHAHINGLIGHNHIDITVTRTDGCGTADWKTLQALLGNPER
jgi:hypothetical protein